ncbi:TMEM165/GDT1 family protein [Rhodococcus maanshanensis]|uniref:GDT1 family protein n=1 Tax=Rhodococcus maanshanensis TaxID=183556 RepID=A0A1H7S0B1_9NOCA|nr:Uncharacterized protein family UPF0016 [Rhodococcus maanshanensis]
MLAALLLSFGVICVAELGDKTMLATITLAADNDWVGVWIGSTLFLVFGVLLLLDGMFPGNPAGPIAAGAILAVAFVAGVVHRARSRRSAARRGAADPSAGERSGARVSYRTAPHNSCSRRVLP